MFSGIRCTEERSTISVRSLTLSEMCPWSTSRISQHALGWRTVTSASDEAFFIGDNFNNDMKYGVYGVLDGHGGKEVAEYAAKNFVTVESG